MNTSRSQRRPLLTARDVVTCLLRRRRDAARSVRSAGAALIALGCALSFISCGSSEEGASDSIRTGSVAQALTDTDGDGLDDAWETTYFGNLSQTAAGDFDADGMTNLEEYTNGFVPTVAGYQMRRLAGAPAPEEDPEDDA